MEWDLCKQQIRMLVIKAEGECRRLEGKPEIMDVTTLYSDGCKRFGVPVEQLKSKDINHLPTPEESAKINPNSPWVLVCPLCNQKSYVIHPICKGCKDSENGKYRSMLKCHKCQHTEKSTKFFSQLAKELGAEIPTGTKEQLGIQTVTDEGLK